MLKRSLQFAPAPTSRSPLPLVLAGVVLIAGTYGMARFGVGLLHPQMVAGRPDLDGALRPAGTAQFTSYCLAVLVGGRLAMRQARRLALAAGLVAGAGALGLMLAPDVATFTAAAFVAGAGAGLASPALVPLLDRAVPTARSGLTQAAVNSGTAVGLLVVGTVVLVTSAALTPWLMVAVVCVGAGWAVHRLAPAVRVVEPGAVPDVEPGIAPDRVAGAAVAARGMSLPWLLAAAAGGVSAYVWTFGPSEVVRDTDLGTEYIGWLWVAVGAGGLIGAVAGRLVDLTGPFLAFLACAAAILLATTVVSTATQPWPAVLGLALFGAAYMALTGTLILWGRVLRPRDAGQATAWLFLALSVGQAVGTVLVGPA
ncbi:MFS transporter [uncultured Serinicoccus sp.]|uniref:MFS transporter n=1 Tax=uncultured Serinicoccus sp. TaxID=735514 RepID=UPI00260C2A12|nr:MFS transporter [uncultured Serinicoccus sp.]